MSGIRPGKSTSPAPKPASHGPKDLALSREIGRRMFEIRKARDPEVTQPMLADATGLSQKQLSMLENGRQQWLSYQIDAVASALGVSPRDLLPGYSAADLTAFEAGLIEALRLDGVSGLIAVLLPVLRNKE